MTDSAETVKKEESATTATTTVVAATETSQNNVPDKQDKKAEVVKEQEITEPQTATITAKPTTTNTTKTTSQPSQTTQKARAAIQGFWGSFSTFANRVVHAVEAEADSIKSEQQALKREAALEKEPPPAKVPPWLDLGTDATDKQRTTISRLVLQLTSSSANFLTIPIATQKQARQVFIDKHAADGEDLTAAEKKHVANTEEDPEKDGFTFELNAALASAEAALKADPKLAKMRNVLVPRRISERNFWRNWLWRVYVIKTTNGVSWPTAGIVTAKTMPTALSSNTDTDGKSSIEDEIRMALDELDEEDEDKNVSIPTEHDDSWTKEVEEALAEKP